MWLSNVAVWICVFYAWVLSVEVLNLWRNLMRSWFLIRFWPKVYNCDWCGDFWWLCIVLFTQILHSVLQLVIILSSPVCKYQWFIHKKGHNKINAIFCLTFFTCNKTLNVWLFCNCNSLPPVTAHRSELEFDLTAYWVGHFSLSRVFLG